MPGPMPWQKMLFRNDHVWVLVGDDGRPILDREGRAEMKYREHDTKTYRPGPANLQPRTGAERAQSPQAAPAPMPSARTKAARPARAASGASAAGASAHGGLEIWTDGACSGNPGPMGIGVVVIDGADREELGEYLGTGTNNIAELVAIERGLDIATKRISTVTQRVRVHSDSSYAIGLLDKGWKAKANQDLVARIRRKLEAFPASVEFVKVPGHAGVPLNERCDALARAAIERRSAVG
jgi:ribonuclease HI